ncbi:MAG: hypothetical protein HY885_14060 [Deltaproteobacteria bacterium]|nr:hypothetical protein [Deltaproteobacteria bacterium]
MLFLNTPTGFAIIDPKNDKEPATYNILRLQHINEQRESAAFFYNKPDMENLAENASDGANNPEPEDNNWAICPKKDYKPETNR